MLAVNSEDGCLALLAAVIGRAVQDARGNRPCNGECKDGAHVCRKDALRFLRSPRCAAILAWLDREERQGELLAIVKGGPHRR